MAVTSYGMPWSYPMHTPPDRVAWCWSGTASSRSTYHTGVTRREDGVPSSGVEYAFLTAVLCRRGDRGRGAGQTWLCSPSLPRAPVGGCASVPEPRGPGSEGPPPRGSQRAELRRWPGASRAGEGLGPLPRSAGTRSVLLASR